MHLHTIIEAAILSGKAFTLDESTDFNVTLQASNGTEAHVIEVGKLDTVVIYKTDKLEQTNYELKISSSTETYCRIMVGQQSDIYLAVGFTVDPSLDISNGTIMFAELIHPVVWLSTQFQSTTKINLSVDDKSQYNEVGVIRDGNCTFEYYFLKAFSCSQNPGFFNVQLVLTTDDGIYTERAFSAYCKKLDVACLNGGTFSGSTCQCTEQYTGDYCEQPICLNGRLYENKCDCMDGFSGEFCGNLNCTSWDFLASYDSNEFEYQSIIFAVQNDQNSVITNQQLIGGIQQFVDKLTSSQKQIKHYSLITFNDKKAENLITTVDTSTFVAEFIKQLNRPSRSRSKKFKTLYSMQLATEISVYRPAIVYVFVNGDTVVDNPIKIMEALSLGGQQINLIYTQSTGISGGSSAYYKEITTSGNGRYIWLEANNIKKLLTDYLPSTVFENALIADELELDCSRQLIFSFPVDSHIQWLTIIARGLEISKSLKLTDDNEKELHPQVIVSGGGSYIATLNQSEATGIKVISLTTSKGECSVQIRAASKVQTDVGFTTDLHDDFPNKRPTIISANNGSTFVTIKVSDSSKSKSEFLPTHVELLSRNLRTGDDFLMTESELIKRDSKRCANQYISTLMNVPMDSYKIQKTPLLVRINGHENGKNMFQRLQLYFPVPIRCQNGGIFSEFGYCTCPPDWTGDDCSVPQCHNKGVADITVCACKSGFYGDVCELVIV